MATIRRKMRTRVAMPINSLVSRQNLGRGKRGLPLFPLPYFILFFLANSLGQRGYRDDGVGKPVVARVREFHLGRLHRLF